ncbi:kinesin-like protein KIN-6 isoform X3 [Populus alba x Populus x berolinensis]|nr:kinesin-like protein KIN-6 isoform X3 [Populus alba x Populus x berolinensis]
MQQATIKGLQEVAISSAAQAESLIACAMLKRTTAMTNTNSQSSRSQCIINIHSFVRDPDAEPNNAVLTIVDLAGAEREKRTGNQGSRLIESNFINNTSMVFGLCLRSLLEHQSNPKKPLKMHFKNSMLTRYLRDYLEGKRRMTLILTVKPGEYDYSDTSYLLRQASPFMKIKFTNVEEPSMLLNKRHIEMLPRVEQAKKMKCSGRYAKTEEGKSVRDEHQLLPKVTKRIYTSDSVSAAPVKLDSVDLPRERNHQVMQNFAKALWNVLKQYKEKLMVAEREIQSLNEVIGNEKTRYLELEKELKDFKSCCSYSLENSTVSTLVNIDTKSKALDPRCQNDFEPGNDQDVFAEAPECNTTQKFDGTPGHEQNKISEIEEKDHFLNLEASECDGSPRKDQGATKKCDYTPRHDQPIFSQIEEKDHFLNLKAPECDGSARKDQGATKKYNYTPGHYQHVFSQIEEKDHFLNLKASECNGSPRKDQGATKKYDDIPGHDQHVFSQTEEHVHSLNLRVSECDDSPRKHQDVVTKKSLDPSVSPKDVASTQKCNLDVPESELLSDSSCKPLNVLKPKRRLLPASSTLLRDIPLGIEDESENPKGNRGAKKSAEETKRTQGSISLLRLLQSNLHV